MKHHAHTNIGLRILLKKERHTAKHQRGTSASHDKREQQRTAGQRQMEGSANVLLNE